MAKIGKSVGKVDAPGADIGKSGCKVDSQPLNQAAGGQWLRRQKCLQGGITAHMRSVEMVGQLM